MTERILKFMLFYHPNDEIQNRKIVQNGNFKIFSVVFYPLFLCIYIIPWQCRQIISFELVMFNCIIKKRRRRWPLNFEIVGGISAFRSRGQRGQKIYNQSDQITYFGRNDKTRLYFK